MVPLTEFSSLPIEYHDEHKANSLSCLRGIVNCGVVTTTSDDDTRTNATGFIITNADATTYVTTTASSQLISLTSLVPPRFVVEYANGMHFYNMPPIPSTLLTLMGQVPDRFVIQYANANRFYGFTYPAAMISDTLPPQITGRLRAT